MVPRRELIALIQPHAPAGKNGRPPFAVQTMLRIHFMQQWFGLRDPSMEEALHDVHLYREFAHLDAGATRLPEESTILRFRHLLEENNLSLQLLATKLATNNATLATKGLMLKTGTVDAKLIGAPSSTKNSSGERDPENASSIHPPFPVCSYLLCQLVIMALNKVWAPEGRSTP